MQFPFNLSGSTILTWQEMSLRLIAAFVFNSVVAFVYFRNYRGFGRPSQLAPVFVLVGMAIAGIIMAISDNLALSLGLVGALSIVRFRSAVKDNRDLAYMFWAISIGLGCGAGNLLLALVMLVAIGIAVCAIEWFNIFNEIGRKYILILDSKMENSASVLTHLDKILPPGYRIKSTNCIKELGTEEVVVLSRFKSEEEFQDARKKLIELGSVTRLNALTPDDAVLN